MRRRTIREGSAAIVVEMDTADPDNSMWLTLHSEDYEIGGVVVGLKTAAKLHAALGELLAAADRRRRRSR